MPSGPAVDSFVHIACRLVAPRRPSPYRLRSFIMPRPPVVLCYGTRPQIIKASLLRRALSTVADCLAIDTGQHYDFKLSELLYNQLKVAPADIYLEVGSSTHAQQTAALLTRAERVFSDRRPSMVVVIGDTNSTLGAALAAAKLRIPVAHVEAGLRSADMLMPEEINRRVVDAISHLLFAPCDRAERRLMSERSDAQVLNVGDVSYDVLIENLPHLPALESLGLALTEDRFIYATTHRAELTNRPEVLARVLHALAALEMPVVLPLHPRTRAILNSQLSNLRLPAHVHVIEPVGYLESLTLVRLATLVVTDSGGLQREAYWVGTPCVTLRTESEWVETLDLGANRLLDPAGDLDVLGDHLRDASGRWREAGWPRSAYGEGTASLQIADGVRAFLDHA